ncbi:MAG: hypothetical protein H7A32_01305 [Deltaproteobacteria bacterium]|nr:hypothetical protein [Deltaproteobacteria bacterium]
MYVYSIDYKYRCILDDACSDNERRAAIYDWVGAKFLQGDYDGKLSDNEQKKVIDQYGDLKKLDIHSISNYLNHSTKVFLEKNPWAHQFNKNTCMQEKTKGRFKLDLTASLSQGIGFGLGVNHFCGEEFSRLFLPMELLIASNHISKWGLFIEGYGLDSYGPYDPDCNNNKIQPAEKVLLEKIAQSAPNPPQFTEEAVPNNIDSKEVVDEAVKQYYRDKVEYASALVALHIYLKGTTIQGNSPEDLEKKIETVVANYATRYEVNIRDIALRVFKYYKKWNDGSEDFHNNQLIKELIAVANEISSQKIKEEIPNGFRGVIIYQSGSKHLDVLKKIYK